MLKALKNIIKLTKLSWIEEDNIQYMTLEHPIVTIALIKDSIEYFYEKEEGAYGVSLNYLLTANELIELKDCVLCRIGNLLDC